MCNYLTLNYNVTGGSQGGYGGAAPSNSGGYSQGGYNSGKRY